MTAINVNTCIICNINYYYYYYFNFW